MTLKTRVLTRLAFLGLSQRDFATLIEVDKSTLSRSLRMVPPPPRVMEKLSVGLDLTVEELLTGPDEVLVRPHTALADKHSPTAPSFVRLALRHHFLKHAWGLSGKSESLASL